MCLLQVRWDETSPVHRPERVSPWKIEPALAHAPDHLPACQMKRPRVSVPSSTNYSQHAIEGTAHITCLMGNFISIFASASCLFWYKLLSALNFVTRFIKNQRRNFDTE